MTNFSPQNSPALDQLKPGRSEEEDRQKVLGEGLPQSGPGASQACVRCGACMTVCPLYRATGREGAVARGKLNLWELFQAGRLTSPAALRDFLEFCLLCGACTDKCAVGLPVPEIVKAARAEIAGQIGSAFRPPWLLARLAWQAPHLIPRAAPFAPLLNRVKGWLGEESGLAYRLWPALSQALHRFPHLQRLPFRGQAPPYLAGRGPLSIAFFSGCGIEALFPQAGLAFLRICENLETEVVIPPEQGCCGLLAESAGEAELSREQAKALVRTFGSLPVEFVVTACASCSYQLKRLGQILAREPEAEAARRLAAKVREASEFLVQEAAYRPLPLVRPEGVVYHDPCHLCRGQGITAEPRELLQAATGDTLLEAAGQECCGLGGVFGATSPQISRELGQERLAAYEATGAGVLATSCSGCLIQLQRLAENLKVVHLLEILG
ncbi:MAG: (Fe-S)-binding protein [Thermodesulfobacteriota bacterium]